MGGLLFKLIAFAAIFPVWGSVRLLRKVGGPLCLKLDRDSLPQEECLPGCILQTRPAKEFETAAARSS